ERERVAQCVVEAGVRGQSGKVVQSDELGLGEHVPAEQAEADGHDEGPQHEGEEQQHRRPEEDEARQRVASARRGRTQRLSLAPGGQSSRCGLRSHSCSCIASFAALRASWTGWLPKIAASQPLLTSASTRACWSGLGTGVPNSMPVAISSVPSGALSRKESLAATSSRTGTLVPPCSA